LPVSGHTALGVGSCDGVFAAVGFELEPDPVDDDCPELGLLGLVVTPEGSCEQAAAKSEVLTINAQLTATDLTFVVRIVRVSHFVGCTADQRRDTRRHTPIEQFRRYLM
jgi:hypothetical protein